MPLLTKAKVPQVSHSPQEVDLLSLPKLRLHPDLVVLHEKRTTLSTRLTELAELVQQAKVNLKAMEQEEASAVARDAGTWSPSLGYREQEAAITALALEERIVSGALPQVAEAIESLHSQLRHQVSQAADAALLPPLREVVRRMEELEPYFRQMADVLGKQRHLTGDPISRPHLLVGGLPHQIMLMRRSLQMLEVAEGERDAN